MWARDWEAAAVVMACESTSAGHTEGDLKRSHQAESFFVRSPMPKWVCISGGQARGMWGQLALLFTRLRGTTIRSERALLRFNSMDVRERAAYTAHSDAWMLRGGGIDIVTEGPLRTEEMLLNIGPQHPSTHGVLRIVLELDGERIVRAEPVIGYMHRGAEKLSEYRDPRQVLVLMNRHDWLSAFNNELGWIIAIGC